MTLRTQPSPYSLVGLLADLPAPTQIPQGYSFFATDTQQLFILVIDPVTDVHSWVAVAGTGGGVPLPPILELINFTPSDNERIYEIGAVGITATLSIGDAPGTTYLFADATGSSSPNFTLAPDGGKLITGDSHVEVASITITTAQGFFRSVVKLLSGNWVLREGI
jgi:hypothetical protein